MTTDNSFPPEIAPGLEQALELDRIIHDPVRLLILSVLNGADSVSFKFLEAITKLTRGNLSIQTYKLAEAGYITIHKFYRGKTPATSYSITPTGKEALATYMKHLDAIKQGLLAQEEEKQRQSLPNFPARQISS